MSAIEVKNLSKSFTRKGQKLKAVSNVSFTLPEGKALGFIGANGAGKSTTLKCILNFIKPSEGEVSIFGVPVSNYKSRENVSFVAEKPIINDLLTPVEVLSLSLSYYKKTRPYTQQINTWLTRFDVAHAAKKPLKTLSKGMQQRVALAAALVVEPRLLILDEPLSGLDPIGRRDVVNILDEYMKMGGSLLFTSHVLHDVERLADYYCIIHHGQLALFQTAAELMAQSSYQVVVEDAQGIASEQHIEQNDLQAYIESQYAQNKKIVLLKPDLSLEKLFYTTINQ